MDQPCTSATSEHYTKKCNDFCDGIDPYELNNKYCRDEFPIGLNYLDIMNYVIDSDSSYTANSFRSYKSLAAYKLYEAGWIQDFFCKKTTIGYIVGGSVKHSQKMNEKNLKCWTAISNENIVLTAHCSCMAGLGEVCSHSAALLFLVADRTDKLCRPDTSIGEVSCTDVLAAWPVPKLSKITMDKIKNMQWKSGMKKIKPVRDSLAPWDREIDEILQNIQDGGQTSAIMTLRQPFAEHFRKNKKDVEDSIEQQPEIEDLELLKLYFANFYKPEYEQRSLEELQQISSSINIEYTEMQIISIENATKMQFQSKQWYRFRAGRITASYFYKACRTSLIKASISLILNICWPEKHIFYSIQTNHGQKNEPVAREIYKNIRCSNHVNFTVIQTRLIIHKNYPYFGASPDGVVNCDCCSKGTLEIKCPFKPIKKTENGICIAAEKLPVLLINSNGEYVINEQHYYYYQIQMQIVLSDVQYSDFFIWQEKCNFLVRVNRNDEFWEKNYPRAETFSKTFLLPEMLGKYFTNKKIELAKKNN